MRQDRYAVGVDLGGTRVRAALVDEAGTVLRRAAAPTDGAGGPVAIIAQIERLVGEVCPADARRGAVAVGVAAPGPLDTEAGVVLEIPTLPGWEEFPLRETLSAVLGVPVIVENDAIAAAYGEWRFGAGRGTRHLLYVTVSTGIGGGVIVDGRLLRGRRGMAGHVGHICLDPAGPRCSCGAAGCLEAWASGTALAGRARDAVRGDPEGALARLGAGERTDASHLAAAARAGDPAALALLAREAAYLGVGFVGLIHVFSPEIVVMGGGVAHAFDLMAADIHAVIRGRAMRPFRDVTVVRALLGDNSGLVGAAVLAMDREGGGT